MILFLFQAEVNSILAPSGSKTIGLDLSGNRINPKRNDLRLYDSLQRYGIRKYSSMPSGQ